MSLAILIAAAIITAIVLLLGVGALLVRRTQRRAQNMGYPSIGAYLQAAPRSDQEKRDAVDLALKGLVACLLGLVFPPLLLVGIFPLFYGARKIAWAEMGLGLVDDADQPGA